MVLIKELELAFKPQSTEVEAQEDVILADSVLQLANTDFTQVNEFEDFTPGTIRKHVEADMCNAYPGKPTTRKKAFNSTAKKSGESDSDELMQGTEAEESEEEQVHTESSSSAEEEEGDIEEDSEENEYDSDVDGSILGGQKSSTGSDTGEDNESIIKDDSSIDIFSSRARDVESEIAKGSAIQNQFALWEKLIECRIKLQPGLIGINKLFQKDTFNEFKSNIKLDDEECVLKAYPELNDMMKEALELLENCLHLSPEYSQTKSQKRKLLEEEDNIKKSSKKKKGDSSIDLLGELHEEFKPFRNATLETWNEKTRVSSGKINKNDFSAFDLPIAKQIEEILLDRNRLLKRTRTKRSDYCVLGKINNTLPEEAVEENQKKRNQGNIDAEIFDDDDFYHKQLRDFIEKKSSDVSKKGKQWAELQNLRRRMKAKVDTRASKGRKLSYKVHNKLVNFMAPLPCHTWTDEARDELFKSLFR